MILDVIFTYFQKELCLHSQQLPDHLLLPNNENYLKEKGATVAWLEEKHIVCSSRGSSTIGLLISWGGVKIAFPGPSQAWDFPPVCSGNGILCSPSLPRSFTQPFEHVPSASQSAEHQGHMGTQTKGIRPCGINKYRDHYVPIVFISSLKGIVWQPSPTHLGVRDMTFNLIPEEWIQGPAKE